MKNKYSIPSLFPRFAATTLLLSCASFAESGSWGTGSGSGNWSDDGKWVGGQIADGEGETATLSNPASAIKPIITIQGGETYTVGTLQSNAVPAARNYTIAGAGTLHFDNQGEAAKIILGTGTAGINLTVNVNVTGSDGLRIEGANSATQLNWDPASMGITGGISLAGMGLHIWDGGKLGSNALTLGSRLDGEEERYSYLGFEQATAVNSQIVLASSGGGLKYSNSGSTNLHTIEVKGAISESGGSQQMNYVTDTGAGNGMFIVSGNNTYTGDTVIGGPVSAGGLIVRATHDGALGAGVGAGVRFLTAKTALQLDGGVTISDKTISLKGLGYGNSGSLRSLSGENRWEGEVKLEEAGENRIQVDDGVLTIDGEVSGSEVLGKSGNGVLELAAANTHSGKTLVHAGALLLSHKEAAVSSVIELATGARLEVGAGMTADAAGLILRDGSELVFTLGASMAEALLSISGDQVNQGGSGDLYGITIRNGGLMANATYTLLEVEGDWSAALSSFELNIDGAYAGSYLTWDGGVLQLQVIPEASTVWLSLLGGAALCVMARRRGTGHGC